MQRFLKFIKIGLAILLVTTLFSGCGEQNVGASYPLESITKNGSQESRIYRATNKTVPQVSQELSSQRKPKEISKEDPERMFLVYPDVWYHLQRDPQKPADTLIEVDSIDFVRQNYNPSFLEGYIVGSILSNIFGSHGSYTGTYRGYSTKDVYKTPNQYKPPTTQDQKNYPPITVGGSGSITRRGSSNSGNSPSVGSGKSSNTSPPKVNSPPKTKYGGSGGLRRRK